MYCEFRDDFRRGFSAGGSSNDRLRLSGGKRGVGLDGSSGDGFILAHSVITP